MEQLTNVLYLCDYDTVECNLILFFCLQNTCILQNASTGSILFTNAILQFAFCTEQLKLFVLGGCRCSRNYHWKTGGDTQWEKLMMVQLVRTDTNQCCFVNVFIFYWLFSTVSHRLFWCDFSPLCIFKWLHVDRRETFRVWQFSQKGRSQNSTLLLESKWLILGPVLLIL